MSHNVNILYEYWIEYVKSENSILYITMRHELYVGRIRNSIILLIDGLFLIWAQIVKCSIKLGLNEEKLNLKNKTETNNCLF